jgi:hypothetical protein
MFRLFFKYKRPLLSGSTSPLDLHFHCPRVDGVLAEPESNISSLSKRFLILLPVLDMIGRLVLRMSIRSLVGFGHADLHLNCGLYMLIK